MKTILTAAITALLICLVFWWFRGRETTPSRVEVETPGTLVAVDANGKRIGLVSGTAATLTDAQVAIDTPAGLVIVGLRPDRFVHPTRPFVYFDQAGCGGNCFLSVGNEPPEFGAKAAIAGDAQTLFVAKQGGTELLPVKSVLRETACEPFEHEIHAVAAERVMNLAEMYRAPYRIEQAGPDPGSR